ncbi:MAG: beta-N-acetylhexosaminidase [Clostridiales bacterium]|nr:beta-N-acetylhexosaminidase [Clostridiales bacterium]
MTKLIFNGSVDCLKAGIAELAADFSYIPLYEGNDGKKVNVIEREGDTLRVSLSGDKATIEYDKKIHFFRALGLLLQHKDSDFDITEKVYFTLNGPMYDVSQGNAVINRKGCKNILRRMAIMGLNMLMLYCEDSYDVPAQPYFGYMRGRYTEDDIRELDDYADMFGIEMIPCIQVLAHLVDVLKWDVYADIKEDKECLLVGEEKTYNFIRDLIEAAVRPFRTKRIHVGMDEAWHLGRGRYQDLHGVVSKTEIMRIHLARVMEILREMGLKPMMWSDMFFRSCNDGKYYVTEGVKVTQEAIDAAPKDMQLVYWDYYHDDFEDFYLDYIDKHRMFGEPLFAGGIWTWIGFAANYKKTFRTMNPALMACKRKGVKEVFATIWGDNGTECSVYATLLGLSLFAEHNYSFELDEEKLKERFEFCCGTKYEDFMNLRFLDETPGVTEDNMNERNPSKQLMWQDILAGLFDYNFKGLPLNAHYEELAKKFKAACDRNGDYNEFFEYNYHVAHTLAMKSEAGLRLTEIYKSGDKVALKNFVDSYLPELRERVVNLRRVHMNHWYDIYKSFGWDIMDMRYGSLLTRIDSAVEVVNMYLEGKLSTIEELDEVRLPYNGHEGVIRYANYYGKICSASRISPNA